MNDPNQPPDILLKDSKSTPEITQRLFHGRTLQVWRGLVVTEKISGWVDNPRIDLAVEQRKSVVGNRDLTQEEILDLMENLPDIKLKDLRDNIFNNGVRARIILTYNGRLLDGNRRYFAVRSLLNQLPVNDPRKDQFKTIPAYVLHHNCTEDDERHILVEENFTPSLKKEWPDDVKARKIREEVDAGSTVKDVAKKYAWTVRKVTETIRIGSIVDDFMNYATSDPDPDDSLGGGLGLSELDAKNIVASKYQYFNEAQKSFYDELRADLDFKVWFFCALKDGKFKNFAQVREAWKIWESQDAFKIFQEADRDAGKHAKAFLDYQKIGKGVRTATAQIEELVRFLRDLSADEISQLDKSSVEELGEALKKVYEMARAVNR